jgi:hypothetical protein
MLLKRKTVGGFSGGDRPLPTEILEWQVKLRHWTMVHRNGSPHAGVAPLLAVRQPGLGPDVSLHGIICGLLPAPAMLTGKTRDFRGLYERHAAEGARAIYDAGIAYLKAYYQSAADFDPTSFTTLVAADAPPVLALKADPTCALLFYVFDLDETSEEGRHRCLQVNCEAELHADGPLFDNVWWHNAVFHGKLDDQVMIRFSHRSTWDTRFGKLEAVV